jgi:hypothetical protein
LKYPGPQNYWKSPAIKENKRSPKKEKEASEEGEEGSPKVYYMTREKTDKRVYKPMRSYVF